jgi:hypothetical protein
MFLAQYVFRQYLEPGEKILAAFHRHPFVPDFILFIGVWLFISVIRLIKIGLIWYHDALLITDVSLLDVCWNGIFDRTSARLEYPMIEGVTLEIRKFRRVLFNYGDITVQGAGGGTNIALRDVMNPKRVERMIMMHQEKFVTDQGLKDSESLKTLLTSMIRQHAAQVEEAEEVNN